MEGKPRQDTSGDIEGWELELVQMIASRFRTDDRQDLTAELARKLAQLKRQRPPGIRNWKAYLAKFLHNKAANFVRDWRTRHKRQVNMPEREDALRSHWPPIPSASDLAESRLAFSMLGNELDPDLRLAWIVLAQCNGNRALAARLLGIHRNTVLKRLRRIKRLLKKHGFTGLADE